MPDEMPAEMFDSLTVMVDHPMTMADLEPLMMAIMLFKGVKAVMPENEHKEAKPPADAPA